MSTEDHHEQLKQVLSSHQVRIILITNLNQRLHPCLSPQKIFAFSPPRLAKSLRPFDSIYLAITSYFSILVLTQKDGLYPLSLDFSRILNPTQK